MKTIKDILRCEDERQNLKHMGFCMLMVFALVVGAFGTAYLKHLFNGKPRGIQSEQLAVETETH